MKTLLTALFIFIATATLKAQPYVIIPDAVFRSYIDSIVPGAIVGNNLNTTHPGLYNVTSIDVSYRGIYDLTGVEYFPNLYTLLCGNNYLTNLPPLANSIDYLGCDNNQLSYISQLPASLGVLHCENNQLGSLPALPSGLLGLSCGNNNLVTLPALPAMLGNLRCENNQLGSLPALPAGIWQLSCGNNNLGTLPALPAMLSNLWCENCQLTSLPALPSNIVNMSCMNNLLTTLPTLPNSLQYLAVGGNAEIWCLPNIPSNGNFSCDIGNVVCPVQGTPDTWFKRASLTFEREMAVSFAVGNKCYVGTGFSNSGKHNDLWEFNPATNVWTQKANLPGPARLQATGFSIGNKGYIGLGQQNAAPYFLRDFWEYNPVTNSWLQKADYPDSAYFGNAAFVIGSKAYVGLGQRNSYIFPSSFFEFNPVANTWTPIATFTSYGRTQASCFTIGNKGYVCGGDYPSGLTPSSYCYNPSTNTWSAIAPMPQSINEAAFFSFNGKGYISCGQCCVWNGSLVTSLVEYDPVLNVWNQRASVPGTGRFRLTGCALNGRAYVGTGEKYSASGAFVKSKDWWEYTPPCTTPPGSIYASGNITFCKGDSVMLFTDYGNNYTWRKNGVVISGANSYFYYAKETGTYSCTISNACASVLSNSINITAAPNPSAAITPSGSTALCTGGSVQLNAQAGVNKSYQWKKGGTNIAGATLSTYTATVAGNYKVTVTNNGSGCSKTTGTATVVTVNPLPDAIVLPMGPTTFCAGDSVVLTANLGIGLTYQWKKAGNIINGATLPSYTAKTAGNYKVQVTTSFGCSKTSPALTVTVPCREGEDIAAFPSLAVPFEVTVFPNPSSGDFIFEFSNMPSENSSIQVYDVVGKLRLSADINNPIESNSVQQFTVKDEQLPAGIYMVLITSGNASEKLKIIKSR